MPGHPVALVENALYRLVAASTRPRQLLTRELLAGRFPAGLLPLGHLPTGMSARGFDLYRDCGAGKGAPCPVGSLLPARPYACEEAIDVTSRRGSAGTAGYVSRRARHGRRSGLPSSGQPGAGYHRAACLRAAGGPQLARGRGPTAGRH